MTGPGGITSPLIHYAPGSPDHAKRYSRRQSSLIVKARAGNRRSTARWSGGISDGR